MTETPPSRSENGSGEPLAAEAMLPLVYDELRKLAAARLAREKIGHTLQPTALVHEAYLRLLGGANPERWENRAHFFSAAATAIRRILVENARRKRSLKRGGAGAREELQEDLVFDLPETREDLVTLDEALKKLAGVETKAAQLVELKYFAGMTLEEAADALGVSPRTSRRLWAYARAWLRREMDERAGPADEF